MSVAISDFPSLSEIRQALDEKRISAVELAQEALAKAEKLKHLNAFLHLDPDPTLAQAKAADARLAKGQQHFLTGVPVAHKDVFVTRDWRTTAASKMLANYQSPFDAAVVESIRDAGMVNIGKLNCDEFAMGSGNENSAFGACLNPWDTAAVPGGSSGGSAVAVATGIVPISTGTDTGGSVRQPAALCGISGIKPTYGTVSRFGMVAFASSLDQAGVFARHACDLAAVLDVMSHFDPRDETNIEHCHGVNNQPGRVKADFTSSLQQFNDPTLPLKGLRIGVPTEYFEEGLAADISKAVEQAIEKFKALGAVQVDISLPRTKLAIPAYYVIAPAEASSNLSRYDGVRYGHRAAQHKGLSTMVASSRSEGFGAEVQRRILIGTYVLSQGYYDAYYLQAQRIRRLIAEDFQVALNNQCDVIMSPVTPHVAKNIGDSRQDITADWLADIYTLGVSLAGLPAMSIPCGFGGDNKKRPIGLQIIGNYFKEGQILALADRYQQATDWHLHTPEV